MMVATLRRDLTVSEATGVEVKLIAFVRSLLTHYTAALILIGIGLLFSPRTILIEYAVPGSALGFACSLSVMSVSLLLSTLHSRAAESLDSQSAPEVNSVFTILTVSEAPLTISIGVAAAAIGVAAVTWSGISQRWVASFVKMMLVSPVSAFTPATNLTLALFRLARWTLRIPTRP